MWHIPQINLKNKYLNGAFWYNAEVYLTCFNAVITHDLVYSTVQRILRICKGGGGGRGY